MKKESNNHLRVPRESIRQKEPDTSSEEIPQIKEIIKYKWNSKNVKIAIAGTQRRSGVTVTAFNMAAWLNSRGANACYVEANTNYHLSWIINVYDAAKNGESYAVGGIPGSGYTVTLREHPATRNTSLR
jgi:hypothetical protein